jgi:nucleoside-diphosphate kinase
MTRGSPSPDDVEGFLFFIIKRQEVCGVTKKMDHESTLVIIKPEAIIRRQASVEIIQILITLGACIKSFRHVVAPLAIVEQHYVVHKGKPFYNKLVRQMTDPVGLIVMVMSGPNIVRRVRELCGAALCLSNGGMTIREAYGISMGWNAIHASSDILSAQTEIALWEPFIHELEQREKTIQSPNEYLLTHKGCKALRSVEIQAVVMRMRKDIETLQQLMESESDLPGFMINTFITNSLTMIIK